MPDRSLLDAAAGQPLSDENLQQLVEAERGMGTQGIVRRWQASDSAAVVLTSDSTGVKISRDNGTTAPTTVINVGTPAGGGLTGTYPNPSLSGAAADLLIPVGIIWPYAGSGIPAGWLPCNGLAVSRTTYAALFAVIGITYGAGDTTTTFNLPDLFGRVILGTGRGHTAAEVGGTETGATHTHTGSHSHGLNNHQHGLGGHTHLEGAHAHLPGSHNHDISGHTHAVTDHAHYEGAHSHDISGHRHDIGHEHLSPPTHPQTSGTPSATAALAVTAGAVALPTSSHTHTYDVPAFGANNSGVSSLVSTGNPNAGSYTAAMTAAANSGTSSALTTGVPVGNTGAVSGTVSVGIPEAPGVSDGNTGSTATDSSAPAAVYTVAATANLPPYQSMQYLIRAGV